MSHYGEAPVDLGPLDLPDWQEFMHYLYLPVRLPEGEGSHGGGAQYAVPDRLDFLEPAIRSAVNDAVALRGPHDPYVYLTARRGFATPGNPLNRPGWHCDDFGGTDLNYIWSDVWPTRLLRATPEFAPRLSADDRLSMLEMSSEARIAEVAASKWEQPPTWIEDAPVGHLLRLSPYVIHDTPVIPAPGGMRSFFKISVSTHRYDLIGNSHNHLLDYDWPMVERETLRNQPVGNRDYSGGAP